MRLRLTAIAIVLLQSSRALALTTSTVSFQNGINSYTGTYDRYIAQTPDSGVDGSLIPDVTLIGSTQQGLIRFDNIFGSNPGQIPLGARIIDASLQLSTIGGPDANNDGSNGPYTVAGLTNAFSSTTTYSTFAGGNGAWFEGGHTTRPQGNFGRLDGGETQATDIRSIVQQWSDQTLVNNGLAVNGGFPTGTDTWRILTTGNTSAGSRPKLNVTYTTDNVQISSFQRGTNGYTNVDSIRLTSKCGGGTGTSTSCTGGVGTEATADGNGLGSMTLQLADSTSKEQVALFRFNDVFGANAGQAPADKRVEKAWLVLTSLGSADTAARIAAPVDAYEMNQAWTTSTLYSNFGANPGLQAGDGDITQETLYRTPAAANNSEIWFDVTDYAERIRNGAPNNGIAIQARSTDGWQFYMNGTGATNQPLRPRFVVMSDLSAGAASPGDFNNDTKVDAADYVFLRKTNAPQGNFDTWRANYGNTGSAAPPKPTTVLKYDASPKNEIISSSTLSPLNVPAAPTPTGVTGLPMSRGDGVVGAGLTNGYSARGWTNGGDKNAAIANNEYYEWGLTLDASHTASLSALDLTLRRGEQTSPNTFELQASFDNFATAPIVLSNFSYNGRADGDAPTPDPSLDTPFYYMNNDVPGRPNTTFSPTDPIPTVDLASVPALQNIAAGSTLKFRLYAWGGTAILEDASLGFRVTGPMVTGIVSSLSGLGTANVPEPASGVLTVMAGLLFLAHRPNRRPK